MFHNSPKIFLFFSFDGVSESPPFHSGKFSFSAFTTDFIKGKRKFCLEELYRPQIPVNSYFFLTIT